MEMQPGVMKKVQRYKKMLFFVNLPLIVGIPAFIEFGLPELQKKDVTMIYTILHLTDFFLCFNSLIIYSVISKLVTAISYLPEENKIKIKQYRDWLLREKVDCYEPKDLIKCKRKTLNPFIGYRSVADANTKFGTESTSLWHDRQLLDSIIFREKPRKVVRPSKK